MDGVPCILPEWLNLKFKNNLGEEDTVNIVNGVMLDGTIDSRAIGSGESEIVRAIAMVDPVQAMEFVNRMYRLGINYGMMRGISISPFLNRDFSR